MTSPEGEVATLDVRTVWQHEALDFTPWLARNLHLLGEELGMELELVQQGKPVGPLYLDILAKEANTEVTVAIENQLEWSDIGHLGQLLTYATGTNARVAIWVAPEFRYEYAMALHRLNLWTRDEIRFFGVKVEVVKGTDDGCSKPRFRKVVYPGGWNKEITLPSDSPPPPYIQKYHDFFQPLIAELIRMGFADSHRQQYDHTGRFFPSRFNRGIGYAASIEKGKDAWVTLHIQTDDNELTKRIFDELLAERDDVESSIDAGAEPEWHWYRYDRYTFSSVNVRRDGSIDDSPEKLDETRAWMLDLLVKFKETFDPHVAKILGGLSPKSDGRLGNSHD